MDSLIPFDEFTAGQAIKGLELERERLRTRLGEVNLVLAKTRTDFAEILETLANRRAPLEYELATLQAKIVSLGGKWKNFDSRWTAKECATDADAGIYRYLYRKIADLLHCQGYFTSPDLLQEANEAVQRHDFLQLYHVYRNVLREVRQVEPPTSLETSSLTGHREEERRALANDLRLLRMAIQSAQEQQDGIETHPLFLAWRAGSHERYIEAICDELRSSLVELEWEIAELQAGNKNRGGLWLVQ